MARIGRRGLGSQTRYSSCRGCKGDNVRVAGVAEEAVFSLSLTSSTTPTLTR
jgi:hypothetical protein